MLTAWYFVSVWVSSAPTCSTSDGSSSQPLQFWLRVRKKDPGRGRERRPKLDPNCVRKSVQLLSFSIFRGTMPSLICSDQFICNRIIRWMACLIDALYRLLLPPPQGPAGDPVVEKYVAMGLGREAASLAVLSFGDDAIKVISSSKPRAWSLPGWPPPPPLFSSFSQVREFVKGYNLLREMGFASKNVAEALVMYDNDTDRALAHFLNSSSWAPLSGAPQILYTLACSNWLHVSLLWILVGPIGECGLFMRCRGGPPACWAGGGGWEAAAAAAQGECALLYKSPSFIRLFGESRE